MPKSTEPYYKERFALWVSPLVMAVCWIFFSMIMGLCNYLNEISKSSDELKNELAITIAQKGQKRFTFLINMRRSVFEGVQNIVRGDLTGQEEISKSEKRGEIKMENITYMMQLTNIVKGVGCAICLVLCSMYLATIMS